MTAAEVWIHLWAVCQAYPLQAIAFVLVVFGLGNVVALILLSPASPTPSEREQDDRDQLAALSRPAELPNNWGRSGGTWWLK